MDRVIVEVGAIGLAMYRREVAILIIKYAIKPLLRRIKKQLVKTEHDAAVYLHALNKQLEKGKKN